jgi:tetratricopeptide (TPR) repeat protein
MIERLEDLMSYTKHPVVHKWASYVQDDDRREEFMQLAMMVVGLSVPDDTEKDYWVLERRLLPHADSCSHWILTELESLYHREELFDKKSIGVVKNIGVVLTATGNLSALYRSQGKLKEAEEISQHVLKGKETVLGPDHTSTLQTVNNLGVLYRDQGKLKEAEEMHKRALKGRDKALGPDHTSTLDSVYNLGTLYYDQDKLKDAEEMFLRALVGYQTLLGPSHQ